jgi:hypothetical protein
MEISQPNNATRPAGRDRRYGIRVTAPPDEFFSNLVGRDWETVHWFATAAERDAALAEMGARHRYSRHTDAPTIQLEAIER